MRRRSFIITLLATSISATGVCAKGFGVHGPQRLLLTIDGIDFATNSESLGGVLASFLAAGLPVNLVVRLGQHPDHLSTNRGLVQLLDRYLTSFPGMVELVPFFPIAGNEEPFEAARAAFDLREGLARFHSEGLTSASFGQSIHSVACKMPIESRAGDALISAGFRNIFALPEVNTAVTARVGGQGVLTLLGGERARLDAVVTYLDKPVASLQRHLVFSALDLATLSMRASQDATRGFSQLLRRLILDQMVVVVLGDELQARTDVMFRRRLAVHIVEPEGMTTHDLKAVAEFCTMMQEAGLPFSRGQNTHRFLSEQSGKAGLIVRLDEAANGHLPKAGHSGDLSDKASFGRSFGAFFGAQTGQAIGLNSQSELTVPVLLEIDSAPSVREHKALSFVSRGDGVILVGPDAVGVPSDRSSVLRFMTSLARTADIQLLDLPSLCRLILPRDNMLTSLLLARGEKRRWQPNNSIAEVDNTERLALLEDARTAWRYFEQSTVSATGLCPATMNATDKPTAGFLSVSMWEVGSHVHALISAVNFGFIEEADFVSRMARLLKTLELASSRRLVLPPETINSRTGKGTTRFNSFDTGRLLIALDRLKGHPLTPKGLEKLVKGWDFAQVIKERKLHSVRAGQFVDDFSSNYADYAALGFRLWGFDVASPLDGLSLPIDADQGMKLLRMTSSFGPIGAEPWLLHLLELSPSPTADFMADYYKAAMTDAEKVAGYLVAPSESPIDRSPWFTYQGFDPAKPDNPWSVQFDRTRISETSVDLTEDLLATSSKAAYLLAAVRPDDDAWRLLSTIRSKARGRIGFDTAAFAKSGRTTNGYTDLNTNAIILHSISKILGMA